MLWNEQDTALEILTATDQAIHAFVQVSASNPLSNWLLTTIYASPNLNTCINLWSELVAFVSSHSLPWVLAGDFNEILTHHEGPNSSPPNRKRMSIFNDLLNNCNLLDLGYNGPRFTSTNKRDNGLVMRCLDKVLANL